MARSLEPVRNHRNEAVVEAARLHRARHRRDTGHTLLEGPAVLRDALEAGCVVHQLFGLADDDAGIALAAEYDLRYMPVSERALQRVSGTETPRGPVAVIEIPPVEPVGDPDILVSWGVSDPGNVGTLIRTAAAFGWGFGFAEGSADPWSPKTLRAGAGGQFQTSIMPVSGLDDLEGWTTLATIVDGGEPPGSVTGEKVAVVIGEEAHGLPSELAASCSKRISIPMPGPAESLNAAVAAGILVYELSKRRGQAGVGV